MLAHGKSSQNTSLRLENLRLWPHRRWPNVHLLVGITVILDRPISSVAAALYPRYIPEVCRSNATMVESYLVVSAFSEVGRTQCYQSKWWSDDGLVSILQHRYHFSGPLEVNYNKLNTSLARDSVFKHTRNEIHESEDGSVRYLTIKKRITYDGNKRRYATFYYIFGSNESLKPLIPTVGAFQDIFNKHRVRKTRSGTPRCVTPPIDNRDVELNNDDEVAAIASQVAPQRFISTKYFDSTEARKLFCPLDSQESVEWAIQRRLSIFENIINNPSTVGDIIEESQQKIRYILGGNCK